MIILEWADDARDQLADIWVAASPEERVHLEPLVLKLELDLLEDPQGVGESRSGTMRVVIRKPLVVWFRARDDNVRIVRVTRPKTN